MVVGVALVVVAGHQRFSPRDSRLDKGDIRKAVAEALDGWVVRSTNLVYPTKKLDPPARPAAAPAACGGSTVAADSMGRRCACVHW